MMDTLPIGSSDPDNQFCISPNCAENFEFTHELLSFPFKKPPVLIAYCRKFIASCQEKLLQETTSERSKEIRASTARARTALGSALHEIDDASAETELVTAIAEAREAGFDEVTFYSLQALGLFYLSTGKLDDARKIYMMSTQYVWSLKTPALWLLMDRIAYALSILDDKFDSVEVLYEWLSSYHNAPLHSLKKRATRLQYLHKTIQLQDEADQVLDEGSCWSIGKSYAANLQLGNMDRAKDLLKQGLDLAKRTQNSVWEVQFDREK
jgi:hypothetical protein